MPTKELQVINSVLENKDVIALFGASNQDMMGPYTEVWGYIKEYYGDYHAIPDLGLVQEKYPELERAEVSGPTAYYVDELRASFLTQRVEKILLRANEEINKPNNGPFVLQKVQESMARLNKFTDTAKDLNVMDFSLAEEHYDTVRAEAIAKGGVPGIPTGIDFFDSAYTSGLAPGDLIVVFGWTGRAKSLWTALVACNAYNMGYRPMITSLEMSGDKMRDRIWTILGSGLFSNSSLALGDISVDSVKAFKSKYEDAGDFMVVTNDGVQELSPAVMQAKIDQMHPSLLVFDYAQLGTDNENSEDMTARMRNMSKQYKRLAVANKIPIILISSATPDKGTNGSEPPMINQVAWSKQLAFDADLAIGVHKHDNSNIVEINCRKNRNGPLFSGYLDWDIDNGKVKEVNLDA